MGTSKEGKKSVFVSKSAKSKCFQLPIAPAFGLFANQTRFARLIYMLYIVSAFGLG
jgi:hypothetical protein